MRPYVLRNREASVEQGAVLCSTLYLMKVRDRGMLYVLLLSLSLSSAPSVFLTPLTASK